MKKKKRTWPFKIIFVLGFLILIYPQVSRIYYRVESTQEVSTFDTAKEKLTDEEVKERMELAKDFNDSLVNKVTEDPYAKNRHDKGRAEYARMLELHEKIGHIQIPSIDVDIPIRAGTSEEVLQTSAGHLEGTSLPIGGNSTHTVITAHSGLPTAKLFSDLKKVKLGDRFYIHNLSETIAYEVDQILTVVPEDFSNLLIVPGHDYATLLTCTPIMVNSHRLLVRGHRVPYSESIDDNFILSSQREFMYKYIFIGTVAFIILMLILIRYYRKKSELLLVDLREINKKQDEVDHGEE
ncbi:class C sortase [Peptoniphilus catoniae]|uniref:class C sortase n=1 Tax=Peptoniphilus catoniae TaxID=1660341 RepID=UPI0010FF5F59|nr:class C sortase [Peptoniphilus catoniae]